MSAAEAVAATVSRLRAAGCVFAEDEARLLGSAARTPGELEAMTTRRVAGEPLEVIVGWSEFCGLRVMVDPGVFVPRQRTGYLVEQAVALTQPGAVVVDLCCGTGAIGAAVATRVPGVELYAVDIEPAAAPAPAVTWSRSAAGFSPETCTARSPASCAAGWMCLSPMRRTSPPARSG